MIQAIRNLWNRIFNPNPVEVNFEQWRGWTIVSVSDNRAALVCRLTSDGRSCELQVSNVIEHVYCEPDSPIRCECNYSPTGYCQGGWEHPDPIEFQLAFEQGELVAYLEDYLAL